MVDLVIVGGGVIGMIAATSAYKNGIRDILILEKEVSLGAKLQQSTHNEFTLHNFGQKLTQSEYVRIYEKKIEDLKICSKLNTMVLNITKDRVITAINPQDGVFQIQAKAIILTMGRREKIKGALNIPGFHPSGIYSVESSQKLVNMKEYTTGKTVVILGLDDAGLIMARRMALEGAKVKAICDVKAYLGTAIQDIESCLNDFAIPLKLGHTIIKIHGKERLEGVSIAKVDENKKAIEGSEEFIGCDTLILPVGLIDESEALKGSIVTLDKNTNGLLVDQNRQTSCDGIFVCSDALHLHNHSDFILQEAQFVGESASCYIKNVNEHKISVDIITDKKIRYVVPQKITQKKDVMLYFRVSDVYHNVKVCAYIKDKCEGLVKKVKVSPNEIQSVLIKSSFLEKCDKLTLTLEQM